MRAVRATIVVPSLFALTFKVVKDPQMALFATFGGFATLVIASFSGTRKDKLVAHAGLAVGLAGLGHVDVSVERVADLRRSPLQQLDEAVERLVGRP